MLRLLVCKLVISRHDFAALTTIESVVYIGAVFIVFNIFSMINFYIVRMRAQLEKLVKAETLELFNGMNEGLLIISAVDKVISFASEPAQQLLRQLPRYQSQMDEGVDSISSNTINR